MITVADWNSMDRVITQTRGRAFSFLLNPQKLGRVFQKPGWAFQKLGRLFWNKCLPESFDQPIHWEFMKKQSVESNLHV